MSKRRLALRLAQNLDNAAELLVCSTLLSAGWHYPPSGRKTKINILSTAARLAARYSAGAWFIGQTM
jgi:hypothetical protein